MSELPPNNPIPPVPPAPVAIPAPGNAKPGKVQAIAIMTLVSGCINALAALIWLLYTLLLGIGTFGIGCVLIVVPLVLGATAIFEIIYALKILPTPIKTSQPSKLVAILEICCIISCSPLQTAAGIIALVFYNDPEVKAYFASQQTTGLPVQ